MISMCPHCGGLNRLPDNKPRAQAKCGKCKQSMYGEQPINMNSAQLDRAISKTDELLVVDFWANWCGPCKQFAPTFSQTSAQLKGKARFIKIETESEQMAATKYNIRSIPTLVIFKNGQEIDRVSGALSAPDFQNWVSQYL